MNMPTHLHLVQLEVCHKYSGDVAVKLMFISQEENHQFNKTTE